jgi:hypothetical protein
VRQIPERGILVLGERAEEAEDHHDGPEHSFPARGFQGMDLKISF